MFKIIRIAHRPIAHLLASRFRGYVSISFFMFNVLLLTFFTGAVFGQNDTVVDQVKEGARSLPEQIKVYGTVLLILFLISGIFYLIRLFLKDKLLKRLLKKYVVFQMKDGRRYRGTMRLEVTGMEIISEESRQRGNAPSYIFTKKEYQEKIVAYIRYHDTMNERELRERSWDLEQVYHPPLIYKLRRKIRNMFVALREASLSAINMVLQNVKRGVSSRVERYDKLYQDIGVGKKSGELTKMDRFDESTDYLEKQETYERLIERLVGTRIKVRVHFGDQKAEYTAILKDYNNEHIALMDVRDNHNNGYRDEWSYEHKFEHNIHRLNRRDDRGLRCRAEGNDKEGYSLIFENNTPYQIQLGHLVLHDGAPQWTRDYKFKYRIQPFSVQTIRIRPVVKHRVGPFERIAVRETLTLKHYKKIRLNFRSFRAADIVFPRKYCTIVESAEKYQPELFSLTGLTDTILDMSDTEDIAISDKDGKPIHGINVVHGYVTNVNEERIDLKTIDASYGRRWDIESAFRRFDSKFRRGFSMYRRLFPRNRAKITAHTAIVELIHTNALRHDALAQLVYPQTRSLNTAEHLARRRKLVRNRVVGSLNAVFNGRPRRANGALAKTPGVVMRSEVQMAMPLKLMALTGNTSNVEFPVLERFEYIHEHHMIYSAVADLRTDRLPKTDILWIGNGEIYKSGYRLNIDAEHRIKNFVSQGGVVIVSGQDVKANARQRRGTGWIPEPLTGIECDETRELIPTFRGKRSRIFQHPNPLNGNAARDLGVQEQPFIRLDDMWLDPLGKWTSLAKTNLASAGLPDEGFEDASALLLLPFQKGLYIVTSLKNETEADAVVNEKIMENLLHFSVKWLDRQRFQRKFQRGNKYLLTR